MWHHNPFGVQIWLIFNSSLSTVRDFNFLVKKENADCVKLFSVSLSVVLCLIICCYKNNI